MAARATPRRKSAWGRTSPSPSPSSGVAADVVVSPSSPRRGMHLPHVSKHMHMGHGNNSFVVTLERCSLDVSWGFSLATSKGQHTIRSVSDDSPATNLLKPDDEILSINRRKAKGVSIDSLRENLKRPLVLSLRVRRDKRRRTLVAVPVLPGDLSLEEDGIELAGHDSTTSANIDNQSSNTNTTTATTNDTASVDAGPSRHAHTTTEQRRGTLLSSRTQPTMRETTLTTPVGRSSTLGGPASTPPCSTRELDFMTPPGAVEAPTAATVPGAVVAEAPTAVSSLERQSTPAADVLRPLPRSEPASAARKKRRLPTLPGKKQPTPRAGREAVEAVAVHIRPAALDSSSSSRLTDRAAAAPAADPSRGRSEASEVAIAIASQQREGARSSVGNIPSPAASRDRFPVAAGASTAPRGAVGHPRPLVSVNGNFELGRQPTPPLISVASVDGTSPVIQRHALGYRVTGPAAVGSTSPPDHSSQRASRADSPASDRSSLKDKGVVVQRSLQPENGQLGIKVVGGKDGLLVKRLDPKSPAAKAGVEPGDTIVAIAGQSVKTLSQDVASSYINNWNSADDADIAVRKPPIQHLTGDRFHVRSMTVGAEPQREYARTGLTAGALRQPLKRVASIDKSQRMSTSGRIIDVHFDKGYANSLGFSMVGGVDTAYGGAFVNAVTPGSDVAEAGLQVGDRLLAIEGVSLMSLSHVKVLDQLNTFRGFVHMVVMQLGPDQWEDLSQEVAGIEATAPVGFMVHYYYRAMALRKHQGHPETETHGELALLKLKKHPGGKWGFKIAGGSESALKGVYVTSITGGAAVAAGLKTGSRILEAQECCLITAKMQKAVSKVKIGKGEMRLLVQVLKQDQWARVFTDPFNLEQLPRPMPTGHTTAGELFSVRVARIHGHLGFTIAGSCDDYLGGVFVERIDDAANFQNGELRVGDRVLSVNGTGLLGVSHTDAVKAFQAGTHNNSLEILAMHLGTHQWDKVCSEVIQLKLDRKRRGWALSRQARSLRLPRSTKAGSGLETSGTIVAARFNKKGQPLGMNVAGGWDTRLGGVFVTTIDPAGVVGRQEKVEPGDRLLEINGRSILRFPQQEVYDLLKESGDDLTLVFQHLGQSQWSAIQSSLRLHLSKMQRHTSAPPTRGSSHSIASSDRRTAHSESSLAAMLNDPSHEHECGTTGLGFTIDGPGVGDADHIRVKTVRPGGIGEREGRLAVSDWIIEINGANVQDESLAHAAARFRSCGDVVEMVIRSAKGSDHTVILRRNLTPATRMELHAMNNANTGISREVTVRRLNGSLGIGIVGRNKRAVAKGGLPGVYVMDIERVSSIAGSKFPRVGDRVVQINGVDVTTWPYEDVMGALVRTDSVILHVRYNPTGFARIRDEWDLELTNRPPKRLNASGILKRSTSWLPQSPGQTMQQSAKAQSKKGASGESKPRQIKLPRRHAGFSLVGPSGLVESNKASGIFVSKIELGSFAEQTGLHVGDQVLQVDGASVRDFSTGQAFDAIQHERAKVLELVVEYNPDGLAEQLALQKQPRTTKAVGRVDFPVPSHPAGFGPSPSMPSIAEADAETPSPSKARETQDMPGLARSIVVNKPAGAPLGISILGGTRPGAIYVEQIEAGSPASQPGMLRVGDRLLNVNSIDFRYAKLDQANKVLSAEATQLRIRATNDPSGMERRKQQLTRARQAGPEGSGGASGPATKQRATLESMPSSITVKRDPVEMLAASPSRTLPKPTERAISQHSLSEGGAHSALASSPGSVAVGGRAGEAGASRASSLMASPQGTMPRATKEEGGAMLTVRLRRASKDPLGFTVGTIAGGHHIVSKIAEGGPVNKLQVADRIVRINDTPTSTFDHQEVAELLNAERELKLEIQRRHPPLPAPARPNVFLEEHDPYPGTTDVFPSPFASRSWQDPEPGYQPAPYTAPDLTGLYPWADAEDGTHMFNRTDGVLDRTSFVGEYRVEAGRPLNPTGRTGICGRGSLPLWGPNHFVDVLITRWAATETGSGVPRKIDGRQVLEFAAVRFRDGNAWSVPKVMLDPDEDVNDGSQRAILSQLLGGRNPVLVASILDQDFHDVMRDIPQDRRNTDNAWCETTAINYHCEDDVFDTLPLKAAAEVTDTTWLAVSADTAVGDRDAQLLAQTANIHGAFFTPRGRRRSSSAIICDICLTKTGPTQGFGFAVASKANGAKIVKSITEGGLADGRLGVRDELLTANGKALTDMSHVDVIAMLSAASELRLTLRRRSSRGRSSSITSMGSDASSIAGSRGVASTGPSPSPTLTKQQAGKGLTPPRTLDFGGAVDGKAETSTVAVARERYGDNYGFGIACSARGRIYVTYTEGAALGKLQPCDELMTINGEPCDTLPFRRIAEIACSRLNIFLAIRRRAKGGLALERTARDGMAIVAPNGTRIQLTDHLDALGADSSDLGRASHVSVRRASVDASFGFDFGSTSTGDHIVGNVSGGKRLATGDKLLAVNGKPTIDLNHAEILAELTSGLTAELDVLRPCEEGQPIAAAVQRTPSGHLRTDYHLRDGSVDSRPFLVHQESVGWLAGSRIEAPEGRLAEDDADIREAAGSYLLVQLHKGSDGFGFAIIGPKPNDRRHGVFVSAVRGPPALSSRLCSGHQLLRVRGKAAEWVDLSNATQADAGKALRGAGSYVELCVRDNVAGFRKYSKSGALAPPADAATQRKESVEHGLQFLSHRAS